LFLATGSNRDTRSVPGGQANGALVIASSCEGSDVTTQPSQTILINGFGLLFVILNAFGLGLRLPVGKLLADAFAHWKILVWALVINFVIIPLLFIGYLLTIASSIPEQIQVGFCVAALCAGMPFAPLLAQLARASVSVATTLLVVLTVGTIIALPIGLPLAVDAVDSQLRPSVWDVAWPLLLFLLLPLVLGCAFRVWWPDLTPPLQQWVVRTSILALLLNLNFTLYAYWHLFTQEWDTGSYIAAIAGPVIGLGSGYLLVSVLRVKDVGIRHAVEITTAVRNIAPMLLMMIFPFVAYPLVTVSITILNTINIVAVVLFVLVWRRAASPSDVAAAIATPSGPA
jgi:bile acid:Na+ symporter, BASS family